MSSIDSLKQKNMKEESAHNKPSQSDPSCGLSNNMNIKPGHLLLWRTQINVLHIKNLPASRQKT